MLPRLSVGMIGLTVLLVIAVPCLVTLPWSLQRYNKQDPANQFQTPSRAEPFGTDSLGRSTLARCLLGGAISLGIGVAAASISVIIGVAWGAVAGLAGGRVDALMMRAVDVLYGLPYILLVVLLQLAMQPGMKNLLAASSLFESQTADQAASILTLLMAIGGVSWLTMARVIRGQVLSLRAQPFVEAARALGLGPGRILRVHILPNLVNPIIVYTTLTIPTAILQESFLSFLGLGVRDPMPSWGNLATHGVKVLPQLIIGPPKPEDPSQLTDVQLRAIEQLARESQAQLWMAVWPLLLLGLTLLALNFLGDALRQKLDPRGER
jgi:oligopeptide transport system permease protein